MRTIKFRAWSKLWKVMSGDVHWIDWQEERIGYSANTKHGWSDENDKLDNVELMQFTGLLDKNGKEIYEGDIVIHPGSGVICKLVYEDGSYGFRDKDNLWQGQLRVYLECEVIGNIWENGDLLN